MKASAVPIGTMLQRMVVSEASSPLWGREMCNGPCQCVIHGLRVPDLTPENTIVSPNLGQVQVLTSSQSPLCRLADCSLRALGPPVLGGSSALTPWVPAAVWTCSLSHTGQATGRNGASLCTPGIRGLAHLRVDCMPVLCSLFEVG